MKRGRGFTVGEGRNVMSCTLCHVYVLLRPSVFDPFLSFSLFDLIFWVLGSERFLLILKAGIHITDLSSALTTLVEHNFPQNSKSLTHPPSTSGFYFLASSPPNNDISFNEITTAIVNNCRARNIIQSTEIERLSPGQAAQIHPWAPMLWGANCRGFSDRLRELGWEARGRGLRESLDEMVEFEVGLLKGQREELVGTWKTDVAIVAEEAVCCF